MLNKLLNIIYPPRCLVCETPLEDHSTAQLGAQVLCESCNPQHGVMRTGDAAAGDNVVWLDNSNFHCERCGEPTTSMGNAPVFCVACQVWPPLPRYVRSVWQYTHQVEAVIKALKYRKKHALIPFLAEAMVRGLRTESGRLFPDTQWDVVVPLPSSNRRVRERGFSHVALLARAFAKQVNCRCDPNALCSSRAREPQARLEPEKRYKNVIDAFSAKRSLVEGQRILLIDDVITTGASVWSATKALLDSGAHYVDTYTLARSRHFGRYRLIPWQHTSAPTSKDRRDVL